MAYHFEGAFSQNELDEVLHSLGRSIFFVQVGANDGITTDPIARHVKELGWSGLLIEPMPDVFEELKSNYAAVDGLIFENVAVTDFEGSVELLRGAASIKHKYPNDGTASIIREQSFFGLNDDRLSIKTMVACCRLQTLLYKNNVQKIDLFVVDVEGADWIVTRQLALDIFHPLAVLIEYKQLSSYERVAFSEHFRNHGYRIFIANDGADALAIRWQALRNTALASKQPLLVDFLDQKSAA